MTAQAQQRTQAPLQGCVKVLITLTISTPLDSQHFNTTRGLKTPFTPSIHVIVTSELQESTVTALGSLPFIVIYQISPSCQICQVHQLNQMHQSRQISQISRSHVALYSIVDCGQLYVVFFEYHKTLCR